MERPLSPFMFPAHRLRKAAQISLKAYGEDLSLKEAALKLGYLTAEQFEDWVRPQDMTHPLER
jgi:fumarate hydratase, class II